MSGDAEYVPAYLPDVSIAIELLETGGAHHRYVDEVKNAAAEIERLRAEVARAVMAEREACAAIADDRADSSHDMTVIVVGVEIANAIRARGTP